jgi:hypothetical protein
MTMARNMWRSTAETFNSCRRSGDEEPSQHRPLKQDADAKSQDADVTTLRIVAKFPLAKTAADTIYVMVSY